MHNQGESDEIRQNEFEEIKQDLQAIRYELLNDMKRGREDNFNSLFLVNHGVHLIADELLKDKINDNRHAEISEKYRKIIKDDLCISSVNPNKQFEQTNEFINDNANQHGILSSLESVDDLSLNKSNQTLSSCYSENEERNNDKFDTRNSISFILPRIKINDSPLFEDDLLQNRFEFDFHAVIDEY
jgi:hypothetical protein